MHLPLLAARCRCAGCCGWLRAPVLPSLCLSRDGGGQRVCGQSAEPGAGRPGHLRHRRRQRGRGRSCQGVREGAAGGGEGEGMQHGAGHTSPIHSMEELGCHYQDQHVYRKALGPSLTCHYGAPSGCCLGPPPQCRCKRCPPCAPRGLVQYIGAAPVGQGPLAQILGPPGMLFLGPRNISALCAAVTRCVH